MSGWQDVPDDDVEWSEEIAFVVCVCGYDDLVLRFSQVVTCPECGREYETEMNCTLSYSEVTRGATDAEGGERG